MNHWTPHDRDAFIEQARHSIVEFKRKDTYTYKLLPKTTAHDSNTVTEHANVIASTVSNVIHNSSTPRLRRIAMNLYDMLLYKITNHGTTAPYAQGHIRVFVKGSTAYSLIDRTASHKPSDVDVAIYINPMLPPQLFDNIKNAVLTITLQSVSQFKRILDAMFFPAGTRRTQLQSSSFLSDTEIEEFKTRMSVDLTNASPPCATYVSPFQNTHIRNYLSNHSFILIDSLAVPDKVVRVQIPHFEKCETIPLRRTPITVSHNRTLNFMRSASTATDAPDGSFDLVRLKMNVLCEHVCDDTKRRKMVPANIVDISIPNAHDTELRQYWAFERAAPVQDQCLWSYTDVDGLKVYVPCAQYLLKELENMLYVYDTTSSDPKREKRQKAYDMLRNFCHRQVQQR
jgi:hypothetical protein